MMELKGHTFKLHSTEDQARDNLLLSQYREGETVIPGEKVVKFGKPTKHKNKSKGSKNDS